MYIPEAGKFRIILESCKHVVLEDPVFVEENDTQKSLELN